MKNTKLLKLHNNPEFKFFVGKVTVNNVGIAVYELDNNNYLLIKEDANDNVLGHAMLTKEAYESLDYDSYNNLVRYYAAEDLCSN